MDTEQRLRSGPISRMVADLPITKAFRVPTPPRLKVQIVERQPISAKRELKLLHRFVWCDACKALLSCRGDYVYDHFIALELGGSNDLDNVRPLCVPCNAMKTALDQKLIAKAKRLAGESGKSQKRRRLPFGRSDKYKQTIDGRRVLRAEARTKNRVSTHGHRGMPPA